MRRTFIALWMALATAAAGAQILTDDDRPDPDLAIAGVAYLTGDHDTALHRFRAAAERGHPLGQYNLAMMLLLGEGTAAKPRQALAWLHKAAYHGLARAQYELAELHVEGRHVPKSLLLAAWWHDQAAQQGWPDSQVKLADMYLGGHGVASDAHQALHWYSRAAAQGDEQARSKVVELRGRLDGI